MFHLRTPTRLVERWSEEWASQTRRRIDHFKTNINSYGLKNAFASRLWGFILGQSQRSHTKQLLRSLY